MTEDPSKTKRDLRLTLKTAAQNRSPAERAHGSERIANLVRSHPTWIKARHILVYAPLKDEPDLSGLWLEALAEGKRLSFPAFDLVAKAYFMAEVRELTKDLQPGHWGVLEPGTGCRRVDANELDLLLVPGLGFSLDGHRLGRGKGYYDRLLAGVQGCKCGVAFEWQIVAGIPMDPHDVYMNCVVTPVRWHPVSTAVL
jgi:5-formyltetrahydrofolate cyclo-ligase